MFRFLTHAAAVLAICLIAVPVGADDPTPPPGKAQSAEETRKAEQSRQGTLVGIGVKLGKHADGLLIEQVLPGYPAEKAGLLAGEVIVSVDGRSTKGMPMEDGVKAITGEEGTEVALEVLNSSGSRRSVKIVREMMKLPGVVTKMLDGGVGYMAISAFNMETASAVRDALTTTLAPDKARGLILDLRGCGSGVYTEVLKVAAMFVDAKEPKTLWVVRRKGKPGEPMRVMTRSIATVPCVVLIDGKTSGAAELLSAALGQNGAKLVGSQTAGGAVLRERKDNADGSSRVVKVGDFVFPETGKTGADGVAPDVVAPEGATPKQVLELGQKTLAELLGG